MKPPPATIAEAFDAWTAIQAQVPGADQNTLNRQCDEQAQIEDLAVRLPMTTARDVWQLLAMATDEGGALTPASETLFQRARDEAATITAEAPVRA